MRSLYTLAVCMILYSPQALCADADNVIYPTAPLAISTSATRLNFTVEVATTAQQLEHGLMFRKEMAKDHGMLFIFGMPQPIKMWMRNTILPLDMLFIDQDGTITQIVHNTKPQSANVIASVSGKIAQVLELNGGAADAYHIATGDRIIYPVPK